MYNRRDGTAKRAATRAGSPVLKNEESDWMFDTEAIKRIQAGRLHALRNSAMAVLLALLVSIVFIAPALTPVGEAWHLAIDVMLMLILASGLVAVLNHRRLALVLAALWMLVIVDRSFEGLVPAPFQPIVRNCSTLGAFLVLAIAVGINVFASGHAIGDRVFGAIVLYLLIGLIWAVAYSAIALHVPHAFAGDVNANSGLADWVYFSYVTLTTVGYGDITPVAKNARALATMEAFIGQLYPAIIIARLVSLQGSIRRS
jgi:hypothetical protein